MGTTEVGDGSSKVTAMMAILGFTLAGMRVFMPEWAFKAEIPRDLRRYIGRWAQEATSDVYTREHRGIVTRIWHKVIPRRELMENLAEVPLDIRDPHYMDNPATWVYTHWRWQGRVNHSLIPLPL